MYLWNLPSHIHHDGLATKVSLRGIRAEFVGGAQTDASVIQRVATTRKYVFILY